MKLLKLFIRNFFILCGIALVASILIRAALLISTHEILNAIIGASIIISFLAIVWALSEKFEKEETNENNRRN